MEHFSVEARPLGCFDVAVAGGGVAGTAAAITAARCGARVVLIENGGCLGGTMTECLMPYIIDADNKGGLVRELLDTLTARGMTCPRRGPKADASGCRFPGNTLDIEGAKYVLDRLCADAGVRVLFHSRVSGVRCTDGHLESLLLTTECGAYALSASLYIDATGSGALAALSGCGWDCGEELGRISPASLGFFVSGMPRDYDGTDSFEEKTAYNDMLERHGISISAEQATVMRLPSLELWDMGVNFEYGVRPDDILALSDAVSRARREVFETISAHRRIPGYERLWLAQTGARLGLREGRRVRGVYRLTDDDILTGRRFEDAVCLVTAGVDVHKLHSKDTTECSRGLRTKPYHIPYRCLVPLGTDNLLLAGRCLSGDFYPHASYRMMGNMTATGEAAGFAAFCCVRESLAPARLDGRRIPPFMRERSYTL